MGMGMVIEFSFVCFKMNVEQLESRISYVNQSLRNCQDLTDEMVPSYHPHPHPHLYPHPHSYPHLHPHHLLFTAVNIGFFWEATIWTWSDDVADS